MRHVMLYAKGIVMVAGTGCAGRKPSILLERQARGPLNVESTIGQPAAWHLEPVVQTTAKGNIEVYVNYASLEFQKNFFNDKKVFGPYAGLTPYYPEFLVFYVKISNKSDKKIRINPVEFIVVDDLGNQYGTVGVDYVTAFAEYRQPFATTTRGVLQEARPGYFGVSVPVGSFLAQKPQGRFAQLQQSSLQPGYVFPGVVYDGLIAFWTPAGEAKKLHLVIANVKTDFDANDWPKTALDFQFDFAATKP